MSKTDTIETVMAQIRVEVSAGEPDDRSRLATAFRGLRRLGYITKANFQCCGGCATSEITQQLQARLGDLVKVDDLPFTEQKYVTWNRQSDDAFNGRFLEGNLYLNWGGNAYTIQSCLAAAGLRVSGGSTNNQSIQVLPKPDQPHRFSPEVRVENQFCHICSRDREDHRVWEGRLYVPPRGRRGYR
jgi:hypothetical protein